MELIVEGTGGSEFQNWRWLLKMQADLKEASARVGATQDRVKWVAAYDPRSISGEQHVILVDRTVMRDRCRESNKK